MFEYFDSCVEIIGFNLKDRKFFMKRIFGIEKEVEWFYVYFVICNFVDEVRVLILFLFFSMLWKIGKLSSFFRKRIELYVVIV